MKKKEKLSFLLSMIIFLSLLIFRPIDFDQGHESIHKDFAPPKPGTYTEDNYMDGSIKVIENTRNELHSDTSPKLSLSLDEINELNDGDAEKVLVIPVGFTDEPFDESHDKAHFEGVMEEMKLYYELNSGYVPSSSGITIDYYVSDIISLNTSMTTYGADGFKNDDANGPVHKLARDAVLALDTVDPSFDFSEYDTDGDNAYNAGLLPTKYSDIYSPNTPISREDMTIIMSNALQLKNGFITMNNTDIQSILKGYTDVDSLDSEAIKAVAIAVNEGLIQGRTLSTIVPEGNLMRAEAAVVIKRLIGII